MNQRIIVLDAGHGGHDPGAVGKRGNRESSLAWLITNAAAIDLREAGEQVVLTRPNLADGPRLQARTDMANSLGAILLVSIHLNGHHTEARGSEVLYFPGSELGIMCAEHCRLALQNDGLDLGPDRGLKARRDLHVLRETDMPAVLIERAFLSNDADELILEQPDTLEAIGRAIARGVLAYLAEYA